MADGVTLYLGDCLEILPTLEAGSIDAVITDPPWMNYVTGWYDASEWHKPIKRIDPQKYSQEIWRLVKDGGAIILWCRWDNFGEHSAALSGAGFTVKNCIVWDKGTHTAGDLNGNFGYRHEMAVFATRNGWRRPGQREQNLWKEPHLFSKAKRHHPTEKPINLMRRSIVSLCGEGATVLDPFMGSGTTGIACVQTGRRFIGIEIDSKYFAIAERRIKEAQQQMVMPL